MLSKKIHAGMAVIVCAFSTSLHAYNGHAVISFAAGAALNDFDHAKLQVTSTETDSLHQNGHHSSLMWSLGLGYDVLINPDISCYLHDVLVGLGLYNVNLEDKGTVYQFGSSSLNNFDYHLPIRTTRLMLEAKLTGNAWHALSPYVVAGVGPSWNRNSYTEIATSANMTTISLNNREQMKFAFQAGLGVQAAVTTSAYLFVEYLYADLGHAKTASSGNMQIVSSASVPLHFNSLTMGLGYSF